jgi:hypothetical protein
MICFRTNVFFNIPRSSGFSYIPVSLWESLETAKPLSVLTHLPISAFTHQRFQCIPVSFLGSRESAKPMYAFTGEESHFSTTSLSLNKRLETVQETRPDPGSIGGRFELICFI